MDMFLVLYLCGLFSFLGLFLLFTHKYVNPYTLTLYFGKKGAGKTTNLTKIALKHIARGWTVYSTEPIVGTYHIEPRDIGYVKLVDYNFKPFDINEYKGIKRFFMRIYNFFFPRKPKILLLIDEVGLVWHCRDFKSFKPEVRRFFKYQRHKHIKCVMFSQSFDVDKTLRDLTDNMFLISNVARVFSYGKKIRKFIDIKETREDGSSTLAECFEFESLFVPFSRSLTFIPYWSKYFDSFEDDVDKDMPLHDCNLVFLGRRKAS